MWLYHVSHSLNQPNVLNRSYVCTDTIQKLVMGLLNSQAYLRIHLQNKVSDPEWSKYHFC